MDQEEAERRDRVLRPFITGKYWDKCPEFSLVRGLVISGHELLERFPFLVEYEWEVVPGRSDLGRGDLLFTNGKGEFAAVEAKWIDLESTGSTARTKRKEDRKKVVEQARDYAEHCLANVLDADWVQALALTNERGLRLVGCRSYAISEDYE